MMHKILFALLIAACTLFYVGIAYAQPYPFSDHYGPYGPRRNWEDTSRGYRDRWYPPAMYPAPRWRDREYPEYRGWRGGPLRMWMYGRPYREW